MVRECHMAAVELLLEMDLMLVMGPMEVDIQHFSYHLADIRMSLLLLLVVVAAVLLEQELEMLVEQGADQQV